MKKNYFDKIIKKNVNKTIDKNKKINEAFFVQNKNFKIITDYLSNDNINNHIELYKGYAENFNKISAELDSIDKENANKNHSLYRSTKLDETFNMNATYLHELYFANIGDNNSQINMDTLSYMRLSRDFGTFDNWQKDFIACALSARNGWAITYLNLYTHSYMNCFIDSHDQQVPAGMLPIIVIDMWEHSFYKDYLKDSKSYLLAMMKQFKWDIIEKRFAKGDQIINIMRDSL